MKMRSFVSLMTAAVLCLSLTTGCTPKDASNNQGTDTQQVKTITSVDDLVGCRIGVQEGTTGNDYANKVQDAQVSAYKNAIDAMTDLANGKLDCVIWDELPSQRAVAKRDGLRIVEGLELTAEEYAIAVQKGNTELLEKINASIARMKSDGTLEAIAKAYKTEDSERMPAVDLSGNTETLVMGTNAQFEPFEYRENNEIVGFDVDMAMQIAKDAGYNLKIEDMEFGGIIAAVQSGKVDMAIAGMTANDERRQNVDFSDPYFTAEQVVVVKE